MQTKMVASSSSSSSNGAPANGEPPAGTKRKADESNLSDDLRFAKRFNLLNIDAAAAAQQPARANSNFYIPVASSSTPAAAAQNYGAATIAASSPFRDDHGSTAMQVDDTRDRVYIHDLDEELADDANTPDDERLIFLPDIDKYFSRLPPHVLQGRSDEDEDGGGKELVLYTVPHSLEVDEEHDNVRKAIIESRQRAREKAAEEARHIDMNCRYDQGGNGIVSAETAHGYSAGYSDSNSQEDPDVMDMD